METIQFSGGRITRLAQSELSLNEVLTLLNVVMGLMVEYIQTVKQLTGGGKTKKEKKAARAAARAADQAAEAAQAAINKAADDKADAIHAELLKKVLDDNSPEAAANENIRETQYSIIIISKLRLQPIILRCKALDQTSIKYT